MGGRDRKEWREQKPQSGCVKERKEEKESKLPDFSLKLGCRALFN